MKDHVFTTDGKEYEVKIALHNQSTILIQVFNTKTKMPANGVKYSIELNTQADMQNIIGINGVQSLIQIAKDDVINNQWDKLSKALKNVPRNLVSRSDIEWY